MAPSASRILVADDEENIRFLLETALTHFGFEVRTAVDGTDAVRVNEEFAPDLIVLDVMMPGLDGFDVLKRLRAQRIATPVLFLTAREETADKVRGLTMGADDYVTKPFSLEEVVARIKAVLRRAGSETGDGVLRYDDLEMDDDAHEVRRGGLVVDLSPTEYKLLRYLLANAGRALSRAQILDHVWEYDWSGDATVVETYVSYLRKKLDPLGPEGPSIIRTIRGHGYALRRDDR
jgi:two-component system OmpR family response regulator